MYVMYAVMCIHIQCSYSHIVKPGWIKYCHSIRPVSRHTHTKAKYACWHTENFEESDSNPQSEYAFPLRTIKTNGYYAHGDVAGVR
jgi:hypothetical protein